jgi:hypothetical protein
MMASPSSEALQLIQNTVQRSIKGLKSCMAFWVLAILSLHIEEKYREGVDGNLGDDHTFSII